LIFSPTVNCGGNFVLGHSSNSNEVEAGTGSIISKSGSGIARISLADIGSKGGVSVSGNDSKNGVVGIGKDTSRQTDLNGIGSQRRSFDLKSSFSSVIILVVW
jgi:hypothetical protein